MVDHHDTTDALMLVELRNQFYRKKFHFLLGVFALSLVVIMILISILVYLINHTTQPYYFVADSLGRFIQEPSVKEPNMSMQDVMDWTKEAVENAYSFDSVNYRGQLQEAEKYFSPKAWDDYMKELTASNNLLTIQQRKWIFVAKANPPKLLTEGFVGGALSWRFEIPLIVSYLKPPLFDEKTVTRNVYVVTVIVQRQKLLESYKGLAIISMVLSSASEPARKLVMPGG